MALQEYCRSLLNTGHQSNMYQTCPLGHEDAKRCGTTVLLPPKSSLPCLVHRCWISSPFQRSAGSNGSFSDSQGSREILLDLKWLKSGSNLQKCCFQKFGVGVYWWSIHVHLTVSCSKPVCVCVCVCVCLRFSKLTISNASPHTNQSVPTLPFTQNGRSCVAVTSSTCCLLVEYVEHRGRGSVLWDVCTGVDPD